LTKDLRAPKMPFLAEKAFMERISEHVPDARVICPDIFRPMEF
jgi:hypothetical protein